MKQETSGKPASIPMIRFDDETSDEVDMGVPLPPTSDYEIDEKLFDELLLNVTVKCLDIRTLNSKRCSSSEQRNDIEDAEKGKRNKNVVRVGSLVGEVLLICL